jgi:uncharacterized membrane-anchored protein
MNSRDDKYMSLVYPEPRAVKVPEIIPLFWLVKVLTTAGGEAGSDYLAHYGNVGGGGTVLVIFLVGIALQARVRHYQALAYWSFAYAIAIFGTSVADFLHLDVGISYAGTSALWAVVLAAVFVLWFRREGTLSIHSITTRPREAFYWSAVFATFALGTAVGDYTAIALNLGYLASGVYFGLAILVPAVAWWKFRLPPVVAFWIAYVLTRPLGASFADYLSKPHTLGGAGFGDGPTFAVLTLAVGALVLYLALARPDVQPSQPGPELRARHDPDPATVPARGARPVGRHVGGGSGGWSRR